MHDNDERREELLQFVLGELSGSRRSALQKAIAEDAELAAALDGLSSAVAALQAENPAQLSGDFNDRLRQRMAEISVPARARIAPGTTLQFTWRWVVHSRIPRVAAAIVLLLAIAGVALWFHGGGATPAFADFLKPILEAKTARYKMIVEMTGASAATMTTEVTMLGPSRTRSEMVTEMPGLPRSRMVQIWDGYKGKQLSLEPEQKRATVFDYIDRPKDETQNNADPLGCWRSFLLDARKVPNMKREPLGEKEIDGRHVIGFRITTPTAVIDAWGDPKTGMPVRIDMTTKLMANVKMTMADFELNVHLDESLFSVEPPAGYKVSIVRVPKTNAAPPGEKDLIETLRYYAELSGGSFPDAVDHETLTEMLYGGLWLFYSLEHSSTSKEDRHQKEHYAVERLFDRGLEFAVLLPKQSDAHYAGRNVSLGAADTPVFWYRPKGARKYRVIYADLAVRETEAPPIAPPPKTGPSERDFIEMLRVYSQWNGGRLPNALDRTTPVEAIAQKDPLADVPATQNKRTSAQWKKTAAAFLKLTRGMHFVDLLPKEADWHYAGKRVSLGAADKPIFWYRPKDAKKYRVIYADLAIRDVEMPPKVPCVLPEKDLIDMFREYAKHADGELPASLDLQNMMNGYSWKIAKELFLDMCTPLNGKLDEKKRHKIEEILQTLTVLQESERDEKKLNKEEKARRKEQLQKIDEEFDKLFDWNKIAPGKKNLSKKQKLHYQDAYTQKYMLSWMPAIIASTMWTQPGLTFANGLPPSADAHYAGKGVKLGAADRPIFWYRPVGVKKYRVIYADLSVHDADKPPSMPNAQPAPEAKPRPRQKGEVGE